jgi:DNA repair protein RadC
MKRARLKFDSTGDDIIALAMCVMESRMRKYGVGLNSPARVREYLCLKLGAAQREHFGVLLLNAQNELIEDRILSVGTLMQTSVYPREVVVAALECASAAVLCYHNHPSGAAEPSRADELLTRTLKEALALVDVKVLDHVIVAGKQATSFVERGLL